MTDANVYSEWSATLQEIVANGGVTLVLGGTDVGKTTFTRLLVNQAVQAGRQAAVIDGDIGQSEIGPPACVGLAFAAGPVAALSELTPHALAFVGSTSPPGHFLEHASAMRTLADMATPRFLVVDTCGYVQGPSARRLLQCEADLLAPTHIVALQRGNELEALLAPLIRRTNWRIHLPSLPAVIGVKPPAFRTQRRSMKWAAYFAGSETHTFSLDEVAVVGAWLGSGTPLAAHLLKYLREALAAHCRVYYAEMSGSQLGMMISHPISPQNNALLMALEPLKARTVIPTVAPRLKNLLVGLESGNGRLMGMGLIAAIDFRRRTVGVLTPVRSPFAARILRIGSLRVTPEGRELGAVKPGEV